MKMSVFFCTISTVIMGMGCVAAAATSRPNGVPTPVANVLHSTLNGANLLFNAEAFAEGEYNTPPPADVQALGNQIRMSCQFANQLSQNDMNEVLTINGVNCPMNSSVTVFEWGNQASWKATAETWERLSNPAFASKVSYLTRTDALNLAGSLTGSNWKSTATEHEEITSLQNDAIVLDHNDIFVGTSNQGTNVLQTWQSTGTFQFDGISHSDTIKYDAKSGFSCVIDGTSVDANQCLYMFGMFNSGLQYAFPHSK